MIHCKELNQSFPDKKSLIKELIKRSAEIMQIKKSAVKYSEPMSWQIMPTEATKDLTQPKEITYGDYVYPIINTTNYLDSHDDVHIDGIWNKSIKEQQGKVYLIVNHELQVGKVISYPKDVEMQLKTLKWYDLGVDSDGTTEALIFKSKLTERSNKDGFEAYKFGDPVQHSIRMQYVKMYLCIEPNNLSAEDMQYGENWEKYYPAIANKERADKQGYFWAVTEAKIFKEGSQVLAGSNDLTPTLYTEPKELTPEAEPSIDTQKLIKEMFNF